MFASSRYNKTYKYLIYLIILAKFSENDPIIPDLACFSSSINRYYYSLKDVRKYEDFCVKQLNYKLDYYTAIDILEHVLSNGFIFSDEILSPCHIEKMYKYAYSTLSSFISDSKSLEYDPLHIAFCCVFMTRSNFALELYRMAEINSFYGVDFESYSDCLNTMQT